ncbi:hypothetical protein SAMN02745194_04608 [Roseomonas rosea]|uniref:PhnA-like protein n=1 Tax=Muricoccus roseus TaxID=198092 RepID=A0A1M6R7K2_9PROT|nr:hypothetical protein [Roseomonas rosea]SHK28455.1 hypothetical protein SAMN02745194_04608 [Roseomonas rosea]
MSGSIQSQSQPSLAARPEGAPVLSHRISWGAIIAGALIAIAVGAALNLLGFAIGLTAVDPTARDTPSASTFGLAGSIWMLVSNLLGLALGGYAAARLSGTSDSPDATLHGAAVWGTAYLVSAVLLGSVVSGAAHTATNALSGAVGGIARGAGQAAQGAVPQMDPEELVNRARVALSGPADPARMTPEQRGAEIASLIGKRVTNGNFSGDDRTRLNRLVAAEAGITEEEAATRVQGFEAEARRTAEEAEQKAREAADEAARAASMAAFWVFAALVLGAGAAILGARTGRRDLVTLSGRRTLS